MAKKLKVTKETTRPKGFTIEQVGSTTPIHAKLSDNIKATVDTMAKQMNVPQWVIINSLCKKGLDSLGK